MDFLLNNLQIFLMLFNLNKYTHKQTNRLVSFSAQLLFADIWFVLS